MILTVTSESVHIVGSIDFEINARNLGMAFFIF
jgi:hypothetical protein